MEVRALHPGQYNLIFRKEGDVFEIKTDKEFSHLWMERTDGKPNSKNAKPSSKKPLEVHNETMEKVLDKQAKADVI